jgi:hypothetical protein
VTRRHIIVEGMDGSGKDTLIKSLIVAFPDHTPHERASTSVGGPVANLADWVVNDVTTMREQPPSIYNRHPLISEPIYAERRHVNTGLKGVWTSDAWIDAWRHAAAPFCTVVICQPTARTVWNNLKRSGEDAHMPGVLDHWSDLYTEYKTLVWPGSSIRYNYKKDTVESLVSLIRKTGI